MQLLECVPNISEGRNKTYIQEIAHVISSVQGVSLLNIDSGFAANRTVYTFVGEPKSIVAAVKAMFRKAHELLSLENHTGEHPRSGVVDVCPIIPLQNITISEAQVYVDEIAQFVGDTLHIPVFLYEHSSHLSHRTKLEQIRSGEYEGFFHKITLPEWKPDFGPQEVSKSFGVSVIGVRDFLVAYNVNLQTTDVSVANKIAQRIRESGYMNSGERIPGMFKSLKAIGWYIEEFGCAQVSTNITDFSKVSLWQVYSAVRQLALEYNTDVNGSELIGLIPENAIVQSGNQIIKEKCLLDVSPISVAVDELGLSALSPFEPNKRILERMI